MRNQTENISLEPKPTAPHESWWTTRSRDRFTETAESEFRRRQGLGEKIPTGRVHRPQAWEVER